MSFFDNAKTITFAGKAVKKLELAGKKIWETVTYKNWVKFSTEADCVTIYNGGLGYKDGYRIRSGGAEATIEDASCTGYIPVKAGYSIRLSGYDATYRGTQNAINVYDESHTNLGQTIANSDNGYGIIGNTWKDYNWRGANGVKEEKTGVWIWIIPPDASIAYIRVTGYTLGDGNKMIVTVNEEIE